MIYEFPLPSPFLWAVDLGSGLKNGNGQNSQQCLASLDRYYSFEANTTKNLPSVVVVEGQAKHETRSFDENPFASFCYESSPCRVHQNLSLLPIKTSSLFPIKVIHLYCVKTWPPSLLPPSPVQHGFISACGFSRSASRLHLGSWLLPFGFISACGFSISASSRLVASPVRLYLGLWLLVPFAQNCTATVPFVQGRSASSRLVASPVRLHLGLCLLQFGFISARGFSRSASSRLVASPVRLYLGLWLLVPFAQTCTATVPFVQGRLASSRLVVPFVQGRSASSRLVASRTPVPFVHTKGRSACGFSYPLYTSRTRLHLGLWLLVPPVTCTLCTLVPFVQTKGRSACGFSPFGFREGEKVAASSFLFFFSSPLYSVCRSASALLCIGFAVRFWRRRREVAASIGFRIDF
ncbi:hypothetical protein MRB53_016935 [Persea americana]|uniref:Uncharacterized protein n=1 Tax=Persea americana TaxID=3435 RepID=A0ACC2M3A4_PERAE|nr:hypothetical protein MRB53_016935 [Persea americana]